MAILWLYHLLRLHSCAACPGISPSLADSGCDGVWRVGEILLSCHKVKLWSLSINLNRGSSMREPVLHGRLCPTSSAGHWLALVRWTRRISRLSDGSLGRTQEVIRMLMLEGWLEIPRNRTKPREWIYSVDSSDFARFPCLPILPVSIETFLLFRMFQKH